MRILASTLVVATVFASTANAQQSRPPLRHLGAAVATSDALGAVAAIQALPGGKLLVNDPSRRQLLLLDSAMKVIAVVADTTPATKGAYGTRGGGLLPFRGDSALFVDPNSLSMLVIDPAGKIARIMAAPRANDVIFLLGGPQGNPGFDAKGRLVYRAQSFGAPRGGMAGQPMQPPVIPDSVPLVRYDLLTRRLDTAAFVRSPAPKFNVVQNERGMSMTSTINPLPEVDDWAVLPDGTIAILRKDYHVDYIDANGQKTSAPKIPFDWQRLSDSAKAAIIDSAKARMARARAGGPGGGFVVTREGPGGNDVVAGGGGPGAGPGAGAPVIVFRTERAEGGPPMRGGAPTGDRPVGPPPLSFVEPSELPDYQPAFTTGSVRADREGKLWVRTFSALQSNAGPEYDVIDRTGKLVDRVALPAGTTIAGFGPGGTVYLGVRDASGTHITRAHER
ncbi:MAG: hypothetical protein JF589_06705 [Gemmatimonadetes bacterium]|nr:hypothetical protein [Gemmatimonadota bacterium]